jgi:hypothetical protein
MAHGTFLFDQLCEMSELVQGQECLRRAEPASKAQPKSPPRYDWDAASEKRIAAEIITRRTRGDSYGVIAHELNRQGIAGRLGGRWYAASVRHYFRKLL